MLLPYLISLLISMLVSSRVFFGNGLRQATTGFEIAVIVGECYL
jgi:hypothetical protein